MKGYPTTWGARPYADQRFDYDATVVRKLQSACAVFDWQGVHDRACRRHGYRFASASAPGATKNPWNTEHWTCGSSSGSGAIMAAALAASPRN